MLNEMKQEIDPADYDIVLADDLVNNDGDFYSLTFKMALDEQLGEEYFERCQYSIEHGTEGKRLMEFIGWTATKVIFGLRGMFRDETFLTSVPRNPP